MIITIRSDEFYSDGDERRFFEGLRNISAVSSVKGIGVELFLDINTVKMSKNEMRELIALLWRYKVPLSPLSAFVKNKRFDWLHNKDAYWYAPMFKNN